ncbi:hypothetical protein [Enterococcus sp. AZ103]|uniref:hypothetical protein n=1 Tax=Enterococcus sp. AZ103 TaxID=2774628 RepID=UPI003F1E9958
MAQKLFKCDKCFKLTPLIQKTENLSKGIQRNFFECKNCKAKTTVYFSDKRLRRMIKKQQTLNVQERKAVLQSEIEQRMNELKTIYETSPIL